jgi:hypothetical protein
MKRKSGLSQSELDEIWWRRFRAWSLEQHLKIERGPSRRGHIERPRYRSGPEALPQKGEWVKVCHQGKGTRESVQKGKVRLEIDQELGEKDKYILYLNGITVAKGLSLEEARENGVRVLSWLNKITEVSEELGETEKNE